MFHDYTRKHLYDVTTDNYLGLILHHKETSFFGLFKKYYVEEYERYECSGKHHNHLCIFSFLEWAPTGNVEQFETEEKADEYVNTRLHNEKYTICR